MHFREAGPEDADFLREMLVEAVNWTGQERVGRLDVEREPRLEHYVSGWQRADDFGVVAVGDAGELIGAAWARKLPADDPGYGFVATDVPEISLAVVSAQRGRGVGSGLLESIIEIARPRGSRALSLSVEAGNRAADLYRAAGFRTVGRNENSDTMLLDLRM